MMNLTTIWQNSTTLLLNTLTRISNKPGIETVPSGRTRSTVFQKELKASARLLDLHTILDTTSIILCNSQDDNKSHPE